MVTDIRSAQECDLTSRVQKCWDRLVRLHPLMAWLNDNAQTGCSGMYAEVYVRGKQAGHTIGFAKFLWRARNSSMPNVDLCLSSLVEEIRDMATDHLLELLKSDPWYGGVRLDDNQVAPKRLSQTPQEICFFDNAFTYIVPHGFCCHCAATIKLVYMPKGAWPSDRILVVPRGSLRLYTMHNNPWGKVQITSNVYGDDVAHSWYGRVLCIAPQDCTVICLI